MKQLFKRFLSVLLAAALIFSCSVATATVQEAPAPESDAITKQIQALNTFLDQHTVFSDNGFRTYPAGYAGYYAEKGIKLVLCMTDATDSATQELRSLAERNQIFIQRVSYSLNELEHAWYTLGHWEELGITGGGIDTLHNRVMVNIMNLDEIKTSKFKSTISDSPIYQLVSAVGTIQPTDAAATGKNFSAALKGTTIYEKPDIASKVLLKAEAGAMFVLGKSPSSAWEYVKDIRRQIVGFVWATDLTPLTVPEYGRMESDAVYICRDATLYAEPKAARKLGTLCRGTRINLMGEIKEYYAVWVGTSEKVLAGYIKKLVASPFPSGDPFDILTHGQVVKAYSSKSVKDAPNGLVVLAGPDEKAYPAVSTLKGGDSVGFVQETGSYTQILFKDAKGFNNTGFVKSANLFYPFVSRAPVSSATSADGKFRLDLYLSDGPYHAGKNIDCYATVTYFGKGSRVSFWGSSYLVYVFAQGKIKSEDDIEVMAGDSYSYEIQKSVPVRVGFRKIDGWKPDVYMIEALFDYSLAPGGDRNWMKLSTSATITVQ